MEVLEILEVGRDHIVAAMEAMTLYLTVVSGYLIVAYTVGRNLSKFQLAIITSLFLAFSVFFTWGTYSFFMMANLVFFEGNPNYTGLARLQGLWISSAEALGIIAALAFMFDSHWNKDADT